MPEQSSKSLDIGGTPLPLERSPVLDTFLPKDRSIQKVRQKIFEDIDGYLDLFPVLPEDVPALGYLESLEPGSYALKTRPSVEVLKSLAGFRNNTSEVGLACINGRWVIQIGEEGRAATWWDLTTNSISSRRFFQAEMHSHPGVDKGASQPSDRDILSLDDTIDGFHYIISHDGLQEFHLPNEEGENYGLVKHKNAWKSFVEDYLRLNQEEYNRIGGWNVKRQFFIYRYGLRRIPWEDRQQIEEILVSKEALKPVSPSSQP